MAAVHSTDVLAREERAIYRALRILERRMRDSRTAFTDSTCVRHWLQLHLADRDIEVFCGLFLDSQHRLIECEDLARGTLNSASVYPREVVKAALRHRAAAVIFAHNHPSGVAEPSDADRSLTKRLTDALALIDVSVLDHFVIGAKLPACSFAEGGWL